MPDSLIQKERIRRLNKHAPQKGGYVIYWMQASQRVEYNHALQYAIETANSFKQPLIVYFGITEFPEANERHYHFLLEGLREIQASLKKMGIAMVIRLEPPEQGIIKLAEDASAVITDRGYLKIQKNWRNHAAAKLLCPLIQVETDVIVPVESASLKEEYSAATLRPKITRLLSQYLVDLPEMTPKVKSLSHDFDSIDISNIDPVLKKLNIDRSVKMVGNFTGGTANAKTILKAFIDDKLEYYAEYKNDPNKQYVSDMSPYLHFGQVSPLYIALQVSQIYGKSSNAYLEELVIRRELSMNYVNYNPNYDLFSALPAWSQKTLLNHKNDFREYVYTFDDFEKAATHDVYWNSAQTEMMKKGKMHGYMRMYWGKKIIEWSRTPGEAFEIAIRLNNKYELDGRDPNAFAGIAWCFGKHDRPWSSRPVFGNIRYMNSAGLKRKFDSDAYVKSMKQL